MQAIRVVIVDKARIVREALQVLLHNPPHMTVSTASCISDALASVWEYDLVVLGVTIADEIDSLFAGELGQHLASSDVRVVILSDELGEIHPSALAARKLDALLSRDISADVLRRSLELVMLGQKIFSQWQRSRAVEPRKTPYLVVPMSSGKTRHTADLVRLTRSAPAMGQERHSANEDGAAALSARERDVLTQLVGGLSNKSIGQNLCIDEATVKVHVKRLLRKLKVDNRTQAAIWAVKQGVCVQTDIGPRVEVMQAVGLGRVDGLGKVE